MESYDEEIMTISRNNIFLTSMMAGAVAGTCVDVILFPIDTVKTRLQSQHGFFKSGGFSSLYRGLYPVLLGSAPTAALFFVTYDNIKAHIQPSVDKRYHVLLQMGAASLSEMVACLIRVPIEVMKQRKQAFLLDRNNFSIKFLYRGYWSTVSRDMPFSLVQFPLWERLKDLWHLYIKRDIYPIESAVCGSLSGAVAAAVTTPLDVVKTRIMLACKTTPKAHLKLFSIIKSIYANEGIKGLFAGISYRVMWITLGGFIFFGAYEETKFLISKILTSSLDKITKESKR